MNMVAGCANYLFILPVTWWTALKFVTICGKVRGGKKKVQGAIIMTTVIHAGCMEGNWNMFQDRRKPQKEVGSWCPPKRENARTSVWCQPQSVWMQCKECASTGSHMVRHAPDWAVWKWFDTPPGTVCGGGHLHSLMKGPLTRLLNVWQDRFIAISER